MKKHENYEIWLHSDDELSKISGMKVVKREPLRGWPLSVVERITFSDGTSRIYKAYYNLPMEAEFYRKAHSPHIPKVFFNLSDGDRHWLLLEDVNGHHPLNLNREQLLDLSRRVQKIVCGIKAIEPNRYDLSGKGYGSFIGSTIGLLSKLHLEGKLKIVDGGAIAFIEEALSHTDVLSTVHGQCTVLHGDLKCDNILVRSDGEIVIIDWQSILFGPADIDMYSLMATQAIDPVPIAGIGPEILRMALEIRWFADCLDRWMPYPEFLDGKISNIVKHMRHVVENNGYADMKVYCF